VYQPRRSSFSSPEDPAGSAGPRAKRRVAAELGRRGIFVRIGRIEAYLSVEAQSGWFLEREPGGIDCQAWRLRLMAERVPV